jgi:bifunctional non-homologous end joining protein LigD
MKKAHRPAALKTYRAKRDFDATSEPDGDTPVRASRTPRFVVQKHAASRLHYDLRLEIGGVFKSWAVTRGPSRDPGVKRLAVATEDHPLAYGDYEGVIPKGEYGGGTVMIWDRGHWLPEASCEPEAALAKGELKFVMSGEKLKGGYVLVRLKPRPGEKSGRSNWLLIKHRDDYAVPGDDDSLLADNTSVASKRTMDRIAAGTGAAPRAFMAPARRNARAKRRVT